ncbi:ankyrin repeat domain-containing protein [Erythrobacter sp. CCH5-A1]|uniref:ankyrin repeat domain-containing protein n=1 Tax=Erythrobacter sp. CCH5-A1 TaxID=1768792 RepID=UPI0008302D5E|nr:ankyrin repeat domain-containing protein [Erythrobacter sp. CCH5-A1]
MASINDLTRAIRAGDTPRALAMIASGAWLDERDAAPGETPLCAAAGLGNDAVVRALLSAGADPEVPGRFGDRPLHLACRAGNEAAARALIEGGADVNAKTISNPNNAESGQTVLITALASRKLPLIAMLVEHGADPLGTDDHGGSALSYAQSSGGKRIADVLAKAVAARAEAATIGVHDAVRARALGALRAHAARGSRFDEHESDDGLTMLSGLTPLHIAASMAWREGVDFLLTQGVPADVRSRHGLTALMCLGSGKQAAAVARALIAAGADGEAQSPAGMCPLYAAEDIAVVEVLLAAGADPDLRHPDTGATVLLYHCQTAKAPIIAALIAAGADLDARDHAGKGIEFYARSNHRARAVIAERRGLPPRPADALRAAFRELPARAAEPDFAGYAQSLGAAFNRQPSAWKRRKGGLYFHNVSATRIHAHLGESLPTGDDARRHDAALARLAAEARTKGALLFHLDHADPARVPLVLLPLDAALAPLIACGTNANARGGVDHVFEGLANIAALAPFDIYGCGFDFVRAALREVPPDPMPLAQALAALCPAVGDPAELAAELAATGRFTLWWD